MYRELNGLMLNKCKNADARQWTVLRIAVEAYRQKTRIVIRASENRDEQ